MYDLGLDLENGPRSNDLGLDLDRPRSNVNMPFERSHTTFYVCLILPKIVMPELLNILDSNR